MAAKRTSRATARKVKDKWRSKEWYRVLAPDMFNNAQIAETLGDESSKIIGRVTEVTMQDLTGDFSKMHIKLLFRVYDIKGQDAHTQFTGHTLTSDYIRRLTRRKHSKTDGVFDVLTKDKALIRVKPMAVTEKRIQVSQQQAIRKIMGNIVRKEASSRVSSEFIREMLAGNISIAILRACKPIYPLKRVEIRRSEVLRLPTEKVIETAEKAAEEDLKEPPLEEQPGKDMESEVEDVRIPPGSGKEGESPEEPKSDDVEKDVKFTAKKKQDEDT
jgi:small subunit ribosomal protein S3Ae